MGLDNGVMLKVKKEQNYKKAYKLFEHNNVWDEHGEVEVAYWRKCWGVRNAILAAVPNGEDEYHYPVTSENIDAIIKAFRHFLNKRTWTEEADSIWEWDKYTRHNQAKNYVGLLRLRQWLKTHPEDEAYFYDSY